MELLKPFLTGNARYMGYGSPEWYDKLAKFVSSNPYGAKISSLDRDVQKQQVLWDKALAKYGSPEAARKWVAPPGSSFHNKGSAADLQYGTPDARKWAHANAPAYGLAFPLGNEDWHVEPAGQRAAGAPKAMPAGTMAAQPGDVNAAPYASPQGLVPPVPNAPQIMPQGENYFDAFANGLSGLAKGMARTGQQVAPVVKRAGPVGQGGPQLAPLTQQFQLDTTPMPKSRTLAEMLMALS